MIEKVESGIELRYLGRTFELILVTFPIDDIKAFNESDFELSTTVDGAVLRLGVNGNKIILRELLSTNSGNPSPRAVEILLFNF